LLQFFKNIFIPNLTLIFLGVLIIFASVLWDLSFYQLLGNTLVLGICLFLAFFLLKDLKSKKSNHWAWIFLLPTASYLIFLELYSLVFVDLNHKIAILLFVFLYFILFKIVRNLILENKNRKIADLNALKQELANVQYNVLKSKNVIWFLKRCLQDAKKLIALNDKKALEFIDLLTILIRYLLQSRDMVLVGLKKETEMAKTLQQLHFIENNIPINFIISIREEDLENYKVPPFVLQILLDQIFLRVPIIGVTSLEIYIENQVYLVFKYYKRVKTKDLSEEFKDLIVDLQSRYDAIGEYSSIQTIVIQNQNFIKIPLIK
jgi:hypothetical protein